MSHEMFLAIYNASLQTLYMVLVSGILSTLLGLPLGIILFVTGKGRILQQPFVNRSLNFLVNILRSLPFLILLVAIIPLTRLIAGTSIGTTAAIVPLTIGAMPFVARLIENTLQEVPGGLIEAGLAMGATPLQIMLRVLIPESLPGIINATTVTLITLVGYSAMAGVVGGGGLGDLAIRYGYERFNLNVMIVTVVILLVLVQLIQWSGDSLVKRLKK